MTPDSDVIIRLHSIKTSADLLKRKRFTHGTLCSKSRSNDDYLIISSETSGQVLFSTTFGTARFLGIKWPSVHVSHV